MASLRKEAQQDFLNKYNNVVLKNTRLTKQWTKKCIKFSQQESKYENTVITHGKIYLARATVRI